MDSINKRIMTYYQDYKTKGVGIISDCQNVFEIEGTRKFTHDIKAMELTHKMFSTSNHFEENCIYYFCDGLDVVFYIPPYITYNQYSFFVDLLEKIYHYNKEFKEPIKIHATGDNFNINFSEKTEFSIVKKQLNSMKMKIPFFKKKESIIGEELDERVICSNIIQMSHLDRITNSSQLKDSFMILFHLYQIPYYQKYILSIFPDFSIIEGVSYFDWKEIEEKLNDLLKNSSSYQDLFDIFLKGVSYSLEKDILYHMEKSSRYEAFHDKKYQKEIMQSRKIIEENQYTLKKINDQNGETMYEFNRNNQENVNHLIHI